MNDTKHYYVVKVSPEKGLFSVEEVRILDHVTGGYVDLARWNDDKKKQIWVAKYEFVKLTPEAALRVTIAHHTAMIFNLERILNNYNTV